jgi:MFS family permease
MDLHSLRRLSRWQKPRDRFLPVNVRLSLLMFLIYAAPGAIVPLFTLRLQELGFSPTEIGWCCATQALGSLLASLLAGQIADRWFAAEKCLAVASFAAAGLLWLLAGLTTPTAVFAVSLLFWLLMAPSLTLSSAIGFTHVEDARRDYGRIRMWGTVGWVAPGWILGFWLADTSFWSPMIAWLRPDQPHPELADAFRFAASLAVVFGVYALTLPHTPPRRASGAAPLAAVRALRGRAFLTYAICTFGVCVALPFHTQVTPLLLASLGVPAAWIPPALTIAQGSEVASLFMLPWLIARLGVRGAMCLGLIAAVLTLTSLMIGNPVGLVLSGLGLYGLCIGCFLVVGQMYLNHRSRDDVRSSAQALHSVLCGIGLLVGNVLIGQVRVWVGDSFAQTFAVAAILALALLVVFALGFPRETAPAAKQ